VLRAAAQKSRLELVIGALTAATLGLLFFPVRFETGASSSVLVPMGMETNEGRLAALAALAAFGLAASRVLRPERDLSALFPFLAVVLACAAIGLADLSSDLFPTTNHSCPSDPQSYFESDLYDAFGSADEAECPRLTGFNPVAWAWAATFALSIIATVAAFWRSAAPGPRRWVGIVIACALLAVFILVGSLATGLQHLE
jgi:hypothetical protein